MLAGHARGKEFVDYALARLNMVESQIRPNKVTDPRIIEAMLDLPRERFLPKALRGVGYVDTDIPLGQGRVVLEPMVQARLIQAAEIKPSDVVLEIGTGAGYGAAVLGRMASTVVALESDPALARSAQTVLGALGLDNVVIVEGPLRDGHPAQAPYDVIVFAGAVGAVPDPILAQLGQGGRLVAVVAPPGRQGKAMLFTRIAESCPARELFDANSPVLPGFEVEPGFVF